MAVVNFDIGDYHYRAYTESQDIYSINVIDKTKTSYENIPSTITYSGQMWIVSTINSCFDGCTSLTTAPTIPSSVTTMFYCFKGCTSLTTAPTIPSSVTNMDGCFVGCTSLTTAPTIPSSVTNMPSCFSSCTSLTTAPTIPSSVRNMNNCFYNCTSLTTAPTIPSSVTNMTYCFEYCTSLVTASTISNSVTNMEGCFRKCTSLSTAPTIPSSVTDMTYCFSECTSLTTAPTIPSSVTNMPGCFMNCTSLTTAPTIPSSVTNMGGCFYNCVRLQGNLKVNNTPTYYGDILTNASTSLDRYGDLFIITEGSASDTTWRSIANQYQNVHFEADDAIEPTLIVDDFYRTDETIAKNAGSPVDTKPYYNESGRNGWLKITAKYAPSATLANTTLPSGWKQNLYNINLTADGQTPTSSLIPGGFYPSTFSTQQTTNSIVFTFDDDSQHVVTAQAVVQIKDNDNNVVKTLYSDIKSATLLKIYALMDMYHSDELDEEGLRIGGYAEATGFRISMDTSFQGNGYLVTHPSDDAQLISDITALGWDDDVKVDIITNATSYTFIHTQTLTIQFSTSPRDYTISSEITGNKIKAVVNNTNKTITVTATDSGTETLTLMCNVGGYLYSKNLTITAAR